MHSNQKTILLVEDEAVIAMIEEQTLKRHGFNVIVAPSGENAINIVKNTHDIDLILMDINLGKGKMDGTEAAEIILKDNDIPVLFLSSYTQAEVVQKTERITSYGYVVKDSGETVLITSIKMAFKLSDAHQRLKESETRFRRISAMTSDITYSCRTEDDGRFSIEWMAGAADRITGYSSEEIKAQGGWRFMVIEEDITLFEENVLALAPGSQSSCELRIRHKNGDVVWISSFAECVSETQIPGCLLLYGGLVDITARKQVEGDKQKSEDKYRLIAENMADVIAVLDMNLRFTYISPSILRLRGFTVEEAMQQNLDQVMPPESLRVASQAFAEEMRIEASETGKVDRSPKIELEEYRKDGSRIWVEINASYLRDKDGKPTGLLTVTREITKRKQTEKALLESETHYRSLVEGIPGIVYSFSSKRGGVYYSSHVTNLLGYSPEQLYEQPLLWHNSIHPDDLLHIKQVIRETVTGKPFCVEYRIRDAHGNWHWFDDRSFGYQMDGDDTIVKGLALDITERKLADDALRESKEYFSLFMRHSPVYTYIKEVTPNESRVLQASDNFEHMIGIPGPDMIGRTMVELFPPELAAKITDDDWAVVLNGNVLQQDEELNGRNYATIKFPIIQRKKTLLAGYSIDITERKQAEIRLRKLNRTYALLSNINQTIVRVHEPQELIEAACRIAVEQGGFCMAWVGVLDPQKKQIRPAAHAGETGDYLEKLRITLDDSERGHGPTATAQRTGKHVVVNDIKSDPRMPPWREDALRLGYSASAAFPLIVAGEVRGTLNLYAIESDSFDDDEIKLLDEMAANISFALEFAEEEEQRRRTEKDLKRTLESLRKAINTTVQVMVSAVETRDPYTAGHQIRSADLARAIATEMGLPQEKIDGIRMASSIHDIGKLSIPAELLSKPTKLSELEFAIIKEHAQKGFEMLKDVESPWPLAEIVYQHHERMDGSGYPRGLKGEEIIMEAGILAVADVVEAMASHRPYRPAIGLNAALAEIENYKGKLYDANAVDACLRLFREKGFQLEGA